MTSDPKSPSPSSASRTRDHLANERTYLAWMRTALGLMGLGIVLARIDEILPEGMLGVRQSWLLGLLACGLGLVMVAIATKNYFDIRRAIELNTYHPQKWWILIMSVILTAVGIVLIYGIFNLPG
ncbi:MAG: DUF202 domain-containing protein [Phormidium sp. BM_Day4_Bin.17]|nr:DUF202 domain-containing protein [Phormidium sp. BM_Day4_Bin.17]UCJ13750.1 MAG: DUF202 domain-containing protein [Phormidium sp. PBR-2020]